MNASTSAANDYPSGLLEREVVLVRVLDAPRVKVYQAWTAADQFCVWFGPGGYECRVHQMDVRVGGRARFDLIAPDGTVYDNRFDYIEVLPNARLVMHHGNDIDNDPNRFLVTVTFDEQSDGKTILTLRQLHPTAEQRAAVIGFGAVELGLQTMDKLARYVG